MSGDDAQIACTRCGRPVRVSAEQDEVFERMHYVCFHCSSTIPPILTRNAQAGGCPSASLAGGRDHVIETAAELALETAQGAPWANDALPSYLEAFSAWLADSGGSHANQRRVPAGNG